MNVLKFHELKGMPNKITNIAGSFADSCGAIKLNQVSIVFDNSVFIFFFLHGKPHRNNNTFFILINETMGYIAFHAAVWKKTTTLFE